MRRRLLSTLPLLALALTSFAPPAAAQGASDIARAEALFNEATKLLQSENYAEACPKFAASQLLVRGIGVTLFLGECYERQGKTMSAWVQFRQAERIATDKGDKKRATVARERVQRLSGAVPSIQINVAREADVPGLVVKRDGLEVQRSEWGVAEPVDPGEHSVVATAPQKEDWQSTVQTPAKKDLTVIDIKPLVDRATVALPMPSPESKATDPSGTSPDAQPRGDSSEPNRGRTARVLGLGAMGLGVAGVAVGSVFGLVAKSKFSQSNQNSHCNASTDRCDPTGLGLRSDGMSAATVSTVAFLVGGAAVAGGLVLYLTAPSATAPRASIAPAVGLHEASLQLQGAW